VSHKECLTRSVSLGVPQGWPGAPSLRSPEATSLRLGLALIASLMHQKDSLASFSPPGAPVLWASCRGGAVCRPAPVPAHSSCLKSLLPLRGKHWG